MTNKLLKLNLQLFAEGVGDGGATGVSGAPGADGVNSLSNVVYGKVDNGQQSATDGADDRAARFEELIKGEYKDLYDQRMQDTIQRRLKSTHETIDRYNQLTPVVEILANKYGIDDASDIESLRQAIEDDDSYWEDEALEKGISVQQLKESKKLQRENEALREQIRQQEIQDNADRIFADWIEQGKQLEQIYKGFDLDAELENPEFSNLLRLGIDMKTAFEVIHHDEIMYSGMQYAAQTAQRKLTNSIMANGRRPVENGLGSQASAIYKPDVRSLTKADMEEINRRVAAGEKIRF